MSDGKDGDIFTCAHLEVIKREGVGTVYHCNHCKNKGLCAFGNCKALGYECMFYTRKEVAK